MMECITGTVGAMSVDCPCATAGATQEQIDRMKQSKSGLYLDRDLRSHVNFKTTNGADACRSLGKMMTDALLAGEVATNNAIIMALSTEYTSDKAMYKGLVGDSVFRSNLGVNGAYIGQLWRSNITDGRALVKSIRLFTNYTGPTVFNIVRFKRGVNTGEVIFSQAMSLAADTGVMVPNIPAKGIYLPGSKDGVLLDYFFVYERSIAMPKDNQISCNCGNVQFLMGQYFETRGVSMANITQRESVLDGGSNAFGVSIDVEMSCDTDRFVCREYDKSEIATAVAYACLNKAGEFLMDAVIHSPEITRFTMQNRENLYGARNHYRAKFDEFIAYIVKHADISGTDCYICKAKSNDVQISGIIL